MRGSKPAEPAGDTLVPNEPAGAAAAADRTLGRLAAIDVGTNTIRLVLADVLADRSYRQIDDERVLTRLGRGIAETGRLSDAAMEDSAVALGRLRSIAEGYRADVVRAVATSAVRESDNGARFVEMVRQRAGLELEVISSEEEARLAFLSVSQAFDLRSTNVAVVDVGGGSTEVVLSSSQVIERIHGLDLGAVRLSERFGAGDAMSAEAYRALREHVKERVRDEVGRPPFVPSLMIGTGGTFTNLASMSMHRGMSGASADVLPFAVRGYELQRSEVKHFLDLLRKMPLRERASIAGLNPDRADIIVGGLTIIDCVMKQLEVNRLRVHDGGIRSGLLHSMIERHFPSGASRRTGPEDRLRSVRLFAASCKNEQLHADYVARLALQLFDGLAAECEDGAEWATAENRELLNAAAQLHDVGYLISYSDHHKHSYNLIMHSGITGFSHRELAVIANVARYHRGAVPKQKHASFARLDAADRRLVRWLAGILRIAVGLDRSHAQRLDGLRVRRCDGIAVIEVDSRDDPSVELWGAERKSELFEQAFGLIPRFRWSSGPRDGDEAEGCDADGRDA